MFESCINKRANDPIVLISFWAKEFCGGNLTAAALISFFEYGHNGRLSYVNQKASRLAEIGQHYSDKERERDCYQHYTQQDLIRAVFGLSGKNNVIEAKKLLLDSKILTEHENPNKKTDMDRSIYYLFHPEIANEWQDANKVMLDEAAEEYRVFPSKKSKKDSTSFKNKQRENDDTLFKNKQPLFKIKQPLRSIFESNLKKEKEEEEKQTFFEKFSEKKSEKEDLPDWVKKEFNRVKEQGEQYQRECLIKKTDESLSDADSMTIQTIMAANYPTTKIGKKAFVKWINHLKSIGRKLSIDSYSVWLKDFKTKFGKKEADMYEQVEYAIKSDYKSVYPKPENTSKPESNAKPQNKPYGLSKEEKKANTSFPLKGAPKGYVHDKDEELDKINYKEDRNQKNHFLKNLLG